MADAGRLIVIVDWSSRYENNRTRELKKLDWVPVPNRMDGDGYTELLNHPNGAAHLGAWLALLQIASRCDVRGILSRRTIPQDGARPHDVESLARISRVPTAVFEEVLPRLVSIGWIEMQTTEKYDNCTIPQDGAGIPQDDAALRARDSLPFPSVLFPSSEEKNKVAILKIDGKPLFERMIGAFLAAGVKLSEPQMAAAGMEWVSLDDAEWLPATECAEDRAKATEARWMGLPASYLRSKAWQAKGPGRILPDPPGRNGSKREQNLAKAMQIFRAERGEV